MMRKTFVLMGRHRLTIVGQWILVSFLGRSSPAGEDASLLWHIVQPASEHGMSV
ncbi:hypothetical protein WI665_19215 [Vibrio cholerae]